MPELKVKEWPESGDAVDAAHDIGDAKAFVSAATIIAKSAFDCELSAIDANDVGRDIYVLLKRAMQKLTAVDNYIHHSVHE